VIVHQPTVTPAVRSTWWKDERLIPGLLLVVITLAAWAYTLRGPSMAGMAMPLEGFSEVAGEIHGGMAMPEERLPSVTVAARLTDVALFLVGWAVMMVAMMLPSALPLILLYHATARRRLSRRKTLAAVGALLAGYFVVWTIAGVPVYGYNALARDGASAMMLLPGLLLIAGGVHQFTALKHSCHSRCSSPTFFIARQWRPGAFGAARMGALHGVDCVGCCLGVMLALVALGMMNLLWMLTAAVVILFEKTAPEGHRIARPLGVVLVLAGIYFLGMSLISVGGLV
jgi:predicted metal-binding membrane protein